MKQSTLLLRPALAVVLTCSIILPAIARDKSNRANPRGGSRSLARFCPLRGRTPPNRGDARRLSNGRQQLDG